MMGRCCMALCLLLFLSSCSTMRGGKVDGAATARMRAEPSRMVVIAVTNTPGSSGGHAGSTPRGYDDHAAYTASDRAQAELDAVASRFDLQAVGVWSIASLKLQCAVYQLPADAVRDEVLAALRKDSHVRIAEPLQTFETLGTPAPNAPVAAGGAGASAYNDPYWQLQKGFARLDASGAQRWSQGEGVKVAIVDTGVDLAHQDLQGRVALSRNFVDTDSAAFVRDRHGTEVAGIIAAVANNREGIVGIAPQAQLAVFKACWQQSPDTDAARCNSFTLAEALSAAIESGARIINLSLGGPADPLLGDLVKEAIGRGIVVIGAVPPDGRTDGFPTGIPGVIAVDGSDRIDASPRVLHAPGSEIVTLTPGGHYDFVSGSSFSTAHVTGTIALLLALSPNLGIDAIQSNLQATSEAVASAGRGEGAAGTSINACAAVSRLRARAGCGSSMANVSPGGGGLPPPGQSTAQQP